MRPPSRVKNSAFQHQVSIGLAALWISIASLFVGCERQKPISVTDVSEQMCTCFRARKAGDIDARLTPCVDSLINARRAEIAQLHVQQPDSVALRAFLAQVTQHMVLSCDAFGSELSTMYDNFYPRDTSRANLAGIQLLAGELSNAPTPYSTKKLLHELIRWSMKVRLLDQGLRYCTQLKKVDPNEVGAYFASGYAYTQQAKYDLALAEVERAMSIHNETDMALFLALIKRRQAKSKGPR
jgi:tetratricopeptide (TPR) repeat protein